MAKGAKVKKLKQAKLSDNLKEQKSNSPTTSNNNSGSDSNETERGLKRKLDESLEDFQLTMEQFKAELFELREYREKSQKEITTLKEENVRLAELLCEEQYKTRMLLAKTNDNEQYSRNWSIRVFGFPDAEKEDAETSERLVTDIIDRKLGIKLAPAQIEVAHRAGKYVPGARRGIIMQFVSRKVRQKVMKQRKNLKGSGITIAEDLTPHNLRRLNSLKELECVDDAWSHGGKLFAKRSSVPQIVKVIPSSMIIDENIFQTIPSHAQHKEKAAAKQHPSSQSQPQSMPSSAATTASTSAAPSTTTVSAATITTTATTTSSTSKGLMTVSDSKKAPSSASKSQSSQSTDGSKNRKKAGKSNDRCNKQLPGGDPDTDSVMDETIISGGLTPASSSTPKADAQQRLA